MNTINVRLATKEDSPQIAKIHVITWQYAYRRQLPDSYLG